MVGNGILTGLLTQRPIHVEELYEYGRAQELDLKELLHLAAECMSLMESSISTQWSPLHVACCVCTKTQIISILVLKEGWSVNSNQQDVPSPLEIALENKNIIISRFLIELGADAKSFNHRGCTPMYVAISRKQQKACISCATVLIEKGVSVNAIINRETKDKAIHIAVRNGHRSVVSFLLQKGADPNVQNVNGFTPLHEAVVNDQIEILKLLFLHGVDQYKENIFSDTALLTAVRHNMLQFVEEITKNGYDVNKLSGNGMKSPLHDAIRHLHMDILKYLINSGANPNAKLVDGSTALHVLSTDNCSFEMMFQSNANNKLMTQSRNEIAVFLIEKGAEVDKFNIKGLSPLGISLRNGFLRLAKFLISSGADVNSREKSSGETILHLAVPCNRDIINVLLEYGADFNTYNKLNLTPYHFGIIQNIDLKYIKSFLKHNCPYNQNMKIWSRLIKKFNTDTKQFFEAEKQFFEGIKLNNLELVMSAVKGGAVPSSCSEELKYPLHFVACRGYIELTTYLLEQNVSPNIVNDKGETPLYLAAFKGHYNVCCVLLRYGACYDYCDKKCLKTPKQVASENKYYDIVELLDGIDIIFHKARSKKNHVVKLVEKAATENTYQYLMYVNATDKKGNTLLSKVFYYQHHENVRKLMSIRLKYNMSHICT